MNEIDMTAERYYEDREAYCKRKRAEGFTIKTPENNELLLDIDSTEALNIFLDRFDSLQHELYYGWHDKAVYKKVESKTPGHYHIIVTLPFEITNNYQRIALQFALGSDTVRETLSVFRLLNNEPLYSILAMKQ